MSFLLNSINKVNETFRNAGSFNSEFGVFSGFTPIDVLSTIVNKSSECLDVDVMTSGPYPYPYTELGLSSVGKTTLWIQVISSCIDNWYKYYGPVSECIFYSVEMHTTAQRWQDITGWDDKMMQERLRFISKPWSITEIYNDIAVLAKNKIACKKDLEIDTGIRSLDGSSFKTLPTTYVLIDSISSIRSKTELQFDKEGNVKNGDTVGGTSNMDAMQIAKDNTLFINEVKKLCEEAKICIIMINHLVEIPVLDRYNPPKPMLPGLKFNQKIKGGAELVYQSYGVGLLSIKERMFNEKSKIYGDDIHGLISFMETIKNKSGREGVRLPMVFDSDTGYKPELTDFEILYTEGNYGVVGSPLAYKLAILPEVTFTRKTLLSKCHENPLLARALCFTTRLYLLSKFVLNEEAPDLTTLMEAPLDTRIDMILRYSIDYPGYNNRGLFVSDEIIEGVRELNSQLNRFDSYNRLFDPAEAEFIKDDLLLTTDKFDFNNPECKIGETEYYTPVSDDTKWK